MPVQWRFPVWKGNTVETRFLFRSKTTRIPIDLTGSQLVFKAIWEGGSIRKVSGQSGWSIPDPASGQADLILTPAETRLIPTGDKAKYEIERWLDGAQITLLFGTISASEWVNDDA